MKEVTKDEKKTLKNKLREIEKKGLESYALYLNEQLAFASKSANRESYKKYIQKQIKQTSEKIERIDNKLK